MKKLKTQMNKEIWKPIEGYAEYLISNLGRVKSIERTHTTNNRWGKIDRVVGERILKTSKTSGGYLKVSLRKNGISNTFLVHRLVAEAFIPNPDNLPCINHKDENPSNPIYTNLEWCTYKYNSNYGTSKKRISEKHKGKKLSPEHIRKMADSKSISIIQYDKNMNVIAIWTSGKEAEKLTGIDASNISQVCKGKRKTAGGFVWKYNEIKKQVC